MPELLCAFFTFRRGVPFPLLSMKRCQFRMGKPRLAVFERLHNDDDDDGKEIEPESGIKRQYIGGNKFCLP